MADPLFEHTIAAIATAPGRGAVAMLRVSGPEAASVLMRVCPTIGIVPPPRRQVLAAVHHPHSNELIDRALVSYFPAPFSYTGDDTVEISTHGGAITPQLVLDALFAAGAQPAQPGEFTNRALLNGKLDLLQAEAVLDIIDGRSAAFHRAAINQVERGLSGRIEELRSALLELEALLVYSIDFPDEDEPPVPPARVHATAADVLQRIDHLLSTAPEGELLREGALVVLAGRPNSGKSSLFNTLLGTERAIVTQVPGTTRDALEAAITIDGYPFRLVDTAGIRTTSDPVESIGIEVARKYLRAANVVIVCIEAGRAPGPEEKAFIQDLDSSRTIITWTKEDLYPNRSTADGGLAVSALRGTGMEGLRQRLLQVSFGTIVGDPGEAPLVTKQRHARALRAARGEVESFEAAFRSGVPAELAVTHLRSATGQLEDLIGVVSSDDVLGRVFGDFCVGK
ncbi:MAG TPA: tRNA uridine-5-carboxymethylaminomethyl(34) synthesis GTPase MnmE [Longimicrobiaceae bacterium]|nr:tRNA uridine-5-carboxymethylaminomethyl(34) synthesis GTPase MnmE [Longimicrobiaceae bacterium]